MKKIAFCSLLVAVELLVFQCTAPTRDSTGVIGQTTASVIKGSSLIEALLVY